MSLCWYYEGKKPAPSSDPKVPLGTMMHCIAHLHVVRNTLRCVGAHTHTQVDNMHIKAFGI